MGWNWFLLITDDTVLDLNGEPCSLEDLQVGMEGYSTCNVDTMEAIELHFTSLAVESTGII